LGAACNSCDHATWRYFSNAIVEAREMTCPYLDAQVTGYLPSGRQLAGARRPSKKQVQVT
jgi:hypothetical protein